MNRDLKHRLAHSFFFTARTARPCVTSIEAVRTKKALNPEEIHREFEAILRRISAKVRAGLISDEQIKQVRKRIAQELANVRQTP
jgi:hypothetical protein